MGASRGVSERVKERKSSCHGVRVSSHCHRCCCCRPVFVACFLIPKRMFSSEESTAISSLFSSDSSAAAAVAAARECVSDHTGTRRRIKRLSSDPQKAEADRSLPLTHSHSLSLALSSSLTSPSPFLLLSLVCPSVVSPLSGGMQLPSFSLCFPAFASLALLSSGVRGD